MVQALHLYYMLAHTQIHERTARVGPTTLSKAVGVCFRSKGRDQWLCQPTQQTAQHT